jgi:hypothetical protein
MQSICNRVGVHVASMLLEDEIVLVTAPVECDCEIRRWYSDGGATCIALSATGKLLEPLPTFGPRCYRLVASEARLQEANEYAYAHAYFHVRNLITPSGRGPV